MLQASGITDTLTSVFFLDMQEGWIAGQNGTILHTTNGGVLWEKVTSGTTQWLSDISFSDADHGWATGPLGMIHTSDGGSTWIRHGITDIPLNALWFNRDQVGWAVGEGGTILHFEDRGPVGTTPLERTSAKIQLEIYPNPSSGTMTLTYKLPVFSPVKVRIYDLQGRLVTQLIQEWQESGTQSLTLDASELNPGIYICMLESNGMSACTKMIRLR